MRHGLRNSFLAFSVLWCLGTRANAYTPTEAVMQGGDADINQFTNTPSFPTGMEINGSFYNSFGNFTFNSLIPNSQIDGSSITKQGNTFNIPNKLLLLDNVGLVPNSLVNGSSVTKQGTLVGGTNITLTPSGNTTTISASTSGSLIYPATGTPSFPLGLSASTGSFSSNLTFANTKLLDGTNQVFPIVQIQSFTTNTASTNNTGSFTNSNVLVSITPKFNTSKILLFVSGTANQSAGASGYLTLARNGTNLGSASGFAAIAGNNVDPVSIVFYDSPATTSAISYSVQLKTDGGTTLAFPSNSFGTEPTCVIIAAEIAQ